MGVPRRTGAGCPPTGVPGPFERVAAPAIQCGGRGAKGLPARPVPGGDVEMAPEAPRSPVALTTAGPTGHAMARPRGRAARMHVEEEVDRQASMSPVVPD